MKEEICTKKEVLEFMDTQINNKIDELKVELYSSISRDFILKQVNALFDLRHSFDMNYEKQD